MAETVIFTTFSQDSRAYEAPARLKQLAVDEQIVPRDGAVVERAEDGTLHLRDPTGNEDLASLSGGAIVDAERDDDTDTELRRHRREVTAAKVEAKQTEMRKRLGHLVHH
jgi:hypothetical protein